MLVRHEAKNRRKCNLCFFFLSFFSFFRSGQHYWVMKEQTLWGWERGSGGETPSQWMKVSPLGQGMRVTLLSWAGQDSNINQMTRHSHKRRGRINIVDAQTSRTHKRRGRTNVAEDLTLTLMTFALTSFLPQVALTSSFQPYVSLTLCFKP